MNDHVEFRILGPLEAHVGGSLVSVGGSRSRRALAALVLAANRTVSSTRLVSVIWDLRPPPTAALQVQNCLSSLRRTLTAAGLPPESLERGPGGYRLVVREHDVDVFRFERHLATARDSAVAGDTAGALGEVVAGLELWRGPALSGVDSAVLDPELRRLEELRLSAREELARLRIALGEHELAAAELSVLCDEYPLRERLYKLRMLALHSAGRRGEALEVFRTARETFRSELGLDPSQELRDVERLVLTADQAPDRPPDRPSPGQPGTGRARDTAPADVIRSASAERIREARSRAVMDGLVNAVRWVTEVGSPPLATPGRMWTVPRLLPPDIPDFTGRIGQIEHLRSLLAGESRAEWEPTALVVAAIAGMGGIGKTALAVHAAHLTAESYPDGQLYVNLRGAEAAPLDAADVLARFLRATGIDSKAIPPDASERAELYRTHLAGRRVLVVLDNAASEEQIRPLLPGSPTCAVLITSRARLTGIEGARRIHQDVLPPDEAVELLVRAADRELIPTQRGDATEIVQHCGLLPLAVRAAAARLAARPSWRLADLARMLRDQRSRLDQLAAGDLEVRASLALSYQGLDDETRRLFRLLGLFDVPDLPGWVAAAVLQTSMKRGVARVEALVDAHLLSDAGVDAAGQRRYRFHDLVRLYAREHAEVEDSVAVQASAYIRGLGAWLAVAEWMAAQVPGPCLAPIHRSVPRPQLDFARDWALSHEDPLVWFDAERAALMSVVRQACRLNLQELAFDLAGCLKKYFDLRGLHVERGPTYERFVAACRSAGNLRGEPVMLSDPTAPAARPRGQLTSCSRSAWPT
jgi:DNA-binding SARP family transcriptional activator